MRRLVGIAIAVGLALVRLPMQTTTEADIKTASSLWEKIPEEPIMSQTVQEAVFERTHEVIYNEFTPNEADLLMRVTEAEAGNQGEQGMWLVMSVVFNRISSNSFPNNVHDVIYQAHQFATVSNGAINRVVVSLDVHRALARIERGEVAPRVIGFETIDSNELDKYFVRAFEYRDHRFYTEKD